MERHDAAMPKGRRRREGIPLAVAATLLAAALPGCSGLSEWSRNGGKVGPNYAVPPSDAAENWIDYQDPRVTSASQDLAYWWRVFDDPVLDALIADACEQNLSLRAAGERIAEARAQRSIAVGNLFPQVQEAAGAFTWNKASDRTLLGSQDQWFQNHALGFNASWELDLWGRFRRAIESADANLDASIADYDNVQVVLLSDVAATYVQYRTFQERILIARRNVEIQERSHQLATDKFNAGASIERDVTQATQVLEQTRAAIPVLESGRRQAANALCVLLGFSPRDLTARLGEARGIPIAPPELALGIPADLLRRRPDVRRVERQAAAQSALIGVAKADLFPRFSLFGSIGVQAEDFGDLFKTPGSLTGTIGPGFRWDLFNYGRIEGNVQVQEARYRQLALGYQDAVLRAGREAEDAAVAFLKEQERAASLHRSVVAASRTVEITYDQFQQGAIDFTPVFLFEGTLAEQQDQLAISQGQIALNLVDLYRAVGGGWEIRLRDEDLRRPSTQPAATRPATTRPSMTAMPQLATSPAAATRPAAPPR